MNADRPTPDAGAGDLTGETARCPEDGQTPAWHRTVGGTDYYGAPRTNAAFVSCSWRNGHFDLCSLFDVDEMPSERVCTCGLIAVDQMHHLRPGAVTSTPAPENDVKVCAVCERPIVPRGEHGLWPWVHVNPADHMAYPSAPERS